MIAEPVSQLTILFEEVQLDTRYQVFVSSTYEDLRDERREVMQALLELDCMPSGMELFPAASDDQWTIIKQVIEDCDYYIVVVAGRYGSIGPSGKSYTHMEYEYALSIGKPTIGFIHKAPETIPAGQCEQTDAGKKALEDFRLLVKRKTVKSFSTPSELGSVVSRGLIKLMKTHPAIGWVRADALSDVSKGEVLALKQENVELRSKLSALNTVSLAAGVELANGDDVYALLFDITFDDANGVGTTWSKHARLTWNQIAKVILPVASGSVTELTISRALESFCFNSVYLSVKKSEKKLSNLELSTTEQTLRTILVQLQALGYISKKSDNVGKIRWSLTTYGESALVKLYAIPAAKSEVIRPGDSA